MRSSSLLLAMVAFGVSACGGGEDEAADITLEPKSLPGSFQLSGTVTFASTLPSGTRLQLSVTEPNDAQAGALDSSDEVAERPSSSSTNQVSWSIDDIGAGSYLVALSADLSGDGSIGEGDQGGYYRGTTTQPAQYQIEATVIAVTSSRDALDFGAGSMRCKVHWGAACAADADCRGASCVYSSGLRTAQTPGKCSAGACETPVATCGPVLGSAPGSLVEANCFGGP